MNTRQKCVIDDCSFVPETVLQRVEHLRDEHKLTLNTGNKSFDSEKDFLEWKAKTEKDTSSSFVQHRGKKKCKNGFTKRFYYCHRSGYYKTKGKCKRRLKSQGSSKIDCMCSAYLTVSQTLSEQILVSYCLTHIGHSNEQIQYLSLSMEEKQIIAGQLLQGVTQEKILDNIRNSIHGELERIHLTTKKDLNNIEASLMIKGSGLKHKHDATSVALWVEEMEALEEDNPVLFFKSQGDEKEPDLLNITDFCLVIMSSAQRDLLQKFGQEGIVCVDTTHGINAYNFDLTTVMVVDNLGEGFPVAFMISNRQDTDIMEFFFSKIKSKTGIINCKVFMSDITETFYTGWSNKMGPPMQRLFCTWHVDRAWRKNLNKIKNPSKRPAVYKTLRVLLEETNSEKFEVLLPLVLEEMVNDEDTVEFGMYFKEHYSYRYQQWAYSFRKGSGINTNMFLEAMHRTLKYVYLNGKTVKRLDKSIFSLMKMVRDKTFERLIKLTKGKLSYKLNLIRLRHNKSQSITLNCKLSKENLWLVQSQHSEHSYEIERKNETVCCNLTCPDCKICIHMYTCTCTDSVIRNTICKHIHFTLKKLRDKEDSLFSATSFVTDGSVGVNNDEVEIQNHVKTLSSGLLEEPELKVLQSSVKSDAQVLVNMISETPSKEKLQTVRKALRTGISLLKVHERIGEHQIPISDISNKPKKIERQLRFFSTKKKRSTTAQLKKPELSEKLLLESVFKEDCPVIISDKSSVFSVHSYARLLA